MDPMIRLAFFGPETDAALDEETRAAAVARANAMGRLLRWVVPLMALAVGMTIPAAVLGAWPILVLLLVVGGLPVAAIAVARTRLRQYAGQGPGHLSD